MDRDETRRLRLLQLVRASGMTVAEVAKRAGV